MPFPVQNEHSILFVTLDSCRYDTFLAADLPNLKAVGELHKAMAPGTFTYGSHSAMFVGFTPCLSERAEPFLNPKFGKIFKLTGAGFPGKGVEFMELQGRTIIDGLKREGYRALGSGAVGWFNPETATGKHLTQDFDEFFYPGSRHALARQLAWLEPRIQSGEPLFVFLNLGETHAPYYFAGAPWDPAFNPCVPFGTANDAAEASRRQRRCIEFADRLLAPLLGAFRNATTIVCADHGDCWGEDGLWEHGIHHQKVLEVPLLFRLAGIHPRPS